jgi:hypothetical protein
MNYKLEYITRMLTKISHKRLESYVIHRIWNTLDNPDVHFVFQQYVIRKEGKYALADLYLPQINLVVEIDEPAHFQNKEADTIREREISKLVDVVRVKCYNEINGASELCSLEELNLRTDEVTNHIKSKIAELGTDFKAWKGVDTVNDICQRGYISVGENVFLYTIDDIAAIFGTRPKHRGFLRASGVGVPNKPNEVVWWPNTEHKLWDNSISEDGKTITECPRNPTEQESHMRRYLNSKEKRITFLRYKDWLGITSYRFVGVFQINPTKSEKEHKCIWERISDTYQLSIMQ